MRPRLLETEQLDRAIECALSMAASGQWAEATIADVAAEADVPLSKLVHDVGTKLGLLSAYLRRVDQETFENADEETDGLPVRDRLFDLIMCRFDAMEENKTAVGKMMRSALNDPVDALAGAALLGRSLASMLEAAGISTSGLSGFARLNGLGLIYVRAFQVWMSDDSPDMSKTMAELDKRLGQADSLVKWMEQRRPRQGPRLLAPEDLMAEGIHSTPDT